MTTPPPSNSERPVSGHIPALDGVRGLAIALVMMFHQSEVLNQAVTDRGNPLDTFAWRVCRTGWAGVDLFFVLSGFLITGILLDTKPSPGYFKNFYARRALRIFPLYYAVLFVTMRIVPRLAHVSSPVIAGAAREYTDAAPHQIWFWTYLSNIFFAKNGFLGHGIPDVLWSLAIEEQFYLVWPLVVFLVSRKALVRLCVAVIVGALVFRLALFARHVDPVAIYVLTPSRLDTLASGALLAALGREWGGLTRLLPTARLTFLGTGVALATLVVRQAVLFPKLTLQYEPVMLTVGFTLIALFFGALLVLGVAAPAHSPAVRAFEWAPLRTLGKYAYALYLFHLPLQSIVRTVAFKKLHVAEVLGSSLPAQIVFNLMVTAVAFAAAWLSWHLFEKHVLKLKRYFESRPR